MKTLKYILGRDECQYIISIKGDRLLFELNKQIGDRLHFELNGCHCERNEAISPWCHCEERSDVVILHIANLAQFSLFMQLFCLAHVLMLKRSMRKMTSESKGEENCLSSEFAK